MRGLLLVRGEPAFLVGGRGLPKVVAAFGGPDHARVLVGWCAASRTFQDTTGTYVYHEGGAGYGDEPTYLPRYDVRKASNGGIEIAGTSSLPAADPKPAAQRPARCPAAPKYPELPGRAGGVHDTIESFHVVRGRYVVTTESASFCAPVSKTGCAADGWEEYELGTLPGHDLAGSYTWEGDFVVRGDRDGQLTAVRMPGARLVARTDVGTAAVLGAFQAVSREDPLTVRVSVLARHDAQGMRDEFDATDIVVKPDAAVFIGRGHTGPGRPRGDARTLRQYLLDAGDRAPDTFWFVLDARGQAMRVVTHP